jgi:hypothetical protein
VPPDDRKVKPAPDKKSPDKKSPHTEVKGNIGPTIEKEKKAKAPKKKSRDEVIDAADRSCEGLKNNGEQCGRTCVDEGSMLCQLCSERGKNYEHKTIVAIYITDPLTAHS